MNFIVRFIKNNFLILIFSCFGILLICNTHYYINNSIEEEMEMIEKVTERCKNNPEYAGIDWCDSYISGKIEPQYNNFYVRFKEITGISLSLINYCVPLILFIISIYGVSKIFKSGNSLLMLKREKYSKFLKNIFLKTYRYIWFFPVFVILIVVLCLINANFDIQIPINNGITFGENLMRKPFLFIILYVFNVILHSAIYLNIALIVMRKQHNYFLAVIESFLLVIAIELFFELVVYNFFFINILHDLKTGLLFNIINYLHYLFQL